ncbi:hypothetical protein MKZ38_005833 [Zalerion maritima]|uniref:F-box domain-containing protein n=1 Tax=Zalerion maritima TaxID=339359 RepID=A0AAD5RW11_9PEZI|nr:hypothetical protein MKZ38_005833 [Zalerion maritima]
MMDGNMVLCCTLCGVWIKQGRRSSKEWLSRARAARSYRVISSPFLTGIGFIREYDSCLLAPAQPNVDIGESDTNFPGMLLLEEHDPFRNSGDEGRCFVFHDRCWQLLVSKVNLEVSHEHAPSACDEWCAEKSIVKQLFNFLATIELHEKEYLGSRHDYGGASIFFRPTDSRKFPILHRPTDDFVEDIPKELSYVLEDPFDSKGIFNGLEGKPIEWKHDALNPNALPKWKWWMKGGEPKDHDIFGKLPDDVIHQIATLLSSRDVRNTCLASGVVSKAATRDQLPPSFWATRFAPGGEMAFMAPVIRDLAARKHPNRKSDWRQIYFDVERALLAPDDSEFKGIKNRKRIWKALDYFTDSIIPMLQRYQHNHIPWLRPRSSHLPMEYTVGPRAGPSRAWTQSYAPNSGLNSERCLPSLLLGSQSVLWPCDPVTEPLLLGVSRIKFDGRWFISGLRVRPAYGWSNRLAKMMAGLVIEYQEEEILLHKGDRLRGVKVMYCSSGIIGLDFRISLAGDANKTKGMAVNWDIDEAGAGSYSTIYKDWLEPSKPGQSIVGFNIGLDAFRIESFGLILKSHMRGLTSCSSHNGQVVSSRSRTPSQ